MTRWGKGAANRLLSSLRSAAGQPLLGWLLGLKLVYLSLVAFTAWGWGDYDEAALKAIDAQWFDQNGGGWSLAKNVAPLARHFATWDSEHYLYLSQDGYGAGVKSCAFYPLWPLIVRWTAPLAGGNHLIGGLVVSNLCSLAAWVLFYERVRRRWGIELSLRALFEHPTLEGLAPVVAAAIAGKDAVQDGGSLQDGGAPVLPIPCCPIRRRAGRGRFRCPSRSSGCGSSTSCRRATRPITSRSRCG